MGRNLSLYIKLKGKISTTEDRYEKLRLIYQFYLDLDITKVSQNKNVLLLIFYKTNEGLCSFVNQLMSDIPSLKGIDNFQRKLFKYNCSDIKKPFGLIDDKPYLLKGRLNWVHRIINKEFETLNSRLYVIEYIMVNSTVVNKVILNTLDRAISFIGGINKNYLKEFSINTMDFDDDPFSYEY